MDTVITAVRLPLACAASLLLVVFGWPFEIVLGAVLLPFKAMQRSRDELKGDYEGWPVTTFTSIRNVWRWTFHDLSDSSGADRPGLGTFVDRLNNPS